MNKPLQPVGRDHSHTSTIHLTTISSSMLVSDMMPPKHLLPLREGMSMQLLVLRTSTPLKNPTKHISLRILTPHQMISIRYIRPSIAENPPHLYLVCKKISPGNLLLLHPRNHLLLRNMMDLCMFLLRFINSLALKQLLPSRNKNSEALSKMAKKRGIHVTDVTDQRLSIAETNISEVQADSH